MMDSYVASRTRIYHLLSVVFGEAPDAEVWEMLNNGALSELTQAVERPWRYDGTLQDLRREYAEMDHPWQLAARAGADRLQRLSVLCRQELEAWTRQDQDAICHYLAKERELLTGEVKAFIEELWGRRQGGSGTGFYDIVAELALEYLESEQDEIDLWMLASELAASEAVAV